MKFAAKNNDIKRTDADSGEGGVVRIAVSYLKRVTPRAKQMTPR